MKNITFSNIRQVSKLYAEKSNVSPLTVTRKCLEIADKNKNLNAFIRLTPELALEHATESNKRYENNKSLSNLDGIPIAVKDNFCTKNVHTTCASHMLENFIPTYNATVYDKLRNLGSILIGKTNMDQFGMGSGTTDSVFGSSKNPWSKSFEENEWRVCGGSSGGSAVAVASGMCFAALGSDTGGSTRNPASYCGIVGYKPTYGSVSRHGLIPLVNSMDVPGILTRNVDDCVKILNGIAGVDEKDSTTVDKYKKINSPDLENFSLKNMKIGIPIEYHCEGLSKNILETWTEIADLLENHGALVEQVSLPNTALSIAVYSILNQCEVSSNMARYDGIEYGYRSDSTSNIEESYTLTRSKALNEVVINRILAGNYFLLRKNYDKFFKKAMQIRSKIAEDFKIVFQEQNFDILLTPTTLTEAPLYSDFIKSSNRDQCAFQDYCTQPANMAGVPAISIPIKLSNNGLPLSLQLMAPSFSDENLIKVAKWIENHVNFDNSRLCDKIL